MGDIIDSSWFKSPEYEKYRHAANVKEPFCLQPDTYYAGTAWFQRDIEIPDEWKGKRVVLFLERPHWGTRVWLDTIVIGSNTSLSTPHEYDLGKSLKPGKHRLTIRVDNSLVVDIGINSHSITDHTQGNWNGVVGRIELSATAPIWIDDLQVYPDVINKSIEVKGKIGNSTRRSGHGTVIIRVNAETEKNIPATWELEGGSFETKLLLGNIFKPWDEFNPYLDTLTVVLNQGGRPAVLRERLRERAPEGPQAGLAALWLTAWAISAVQSLGRLDALCRREPA